MRIHDVGRDVLQFFDQRTGDAAGFTLIDLRQHLGVGHDVVLAASHRRDVSQGCAAGWSVSSHRDGGDLDPGLFVEIQRRGEGGDGITVTDDDHVLDRCGDLVEGGQSHFQGRFEFRHVARGHAVEQGQHLVALAGNPDESLVASPQPGLPAEVIPVDQPTEIHGAQRLDRLAGHDFLPVISRRHLGRVHHEHQGPDRFDLGVLDLEVHRHRVLQLAYSPNLPPRNCWRPPEHDQAGTHLLRVPDQHLDLFIAETRHVRRIGAAAAGHVGKHHAIVALQFAETREELIAGLDVDLQIHDPQTFHQVIRIPALIAILDQQHAAPASHVGERRGLIVLRQQVVGDIVRHEHRLVGVHGRLVDRVPESHHRLAGRQFDGLLADQFLASAGTDA